MRVRFERQAICSASAQRDGTGARRIQANESRSRAHSRNQSVTGAMSPAPRRIRSRSTTRARSRRRAWSIKQSPRRSSPPRRWRSGSTGGGCGAGAPPGRRCMVGRPELHAAGDNAAAGDIGDAHGFGHGTHRRARDLDASRHQRRGRQLWICIVHDRHADHAGSVERPRRDLVGRVLERREQAEDVHVHHQRQRLGERQRAVTRSSDRDGGDARTRAPAPASSSRSLKNERPCKFEVQRRKWGNDSGQNSSHFRL
jgi:hypothetical protein